MTSRFYRDRGLICQVIVVLLAWSYLCWLGRETDGLWFHPDSSRHALNGIFWKDFFVQWPSDPKAFGMSYFTRYPAVNPVSYPPFFYLLEAPLFAVGGPSPFLAKGLVLLFTLVGTLYLLAWLRRWVAPEAGYAAALVPLLPGIATWSHAVMLNVPAAALCWAGLFHARRWLEEPGSRHFYWAAILCTLAVLTYYPSVVLVPIVAAWAIAVGRWRVLIAPRTLVVAAVCGLLLLPCFLVTLKWASMHVEMTTPAPQILARSTTWIYYPKAAADQFGWPACLFGVAVVVLCLVDIRWRRETVLLLIWIGVTYAFLTYLKAKDGRYLLPCLAPFVLLGSVGVAALASRINALGGRRLVGLAVPALIVGLLLTLGWRAWSKPPPVLRGVREVAEFLDTVAPDEPIFYEGELFSAFIFHVRASDKDMRRMIVRGDKLIYLKAPSGAMRSKEFAFTTGEVVDALLTRTGCRWLVIERAEVKPGSARQLLQEAVQGPQFQHVASFPVTGAWATDAIDVYRVVAEVQRPDEFEIFVPLLGEGAQFKTRPISSRPRQETADPVAGPR